MCLADLGLPFNTQEATAGLKHPKKLIRKLKKSIEILCELGIFIWFGIPTSLPW